MIEVFQFSVVSKTRFSPTTLYRITAAIFAATLIASPALSQIKTDATTGTEPATTLATDLDIGQTRIGTQLGTQTGGFLLHSFDHFNILSGQSVIFETNAATTNIIGRVTQSASRINGGLMVEPSFAGQGVNFILLNPNGINVGANATFGIPGRLTLAAADRVIDSGGNFFSASDLGGSSLAIADPADFGFLTGDVTLTDTVVLDGDATSVAVRGGSVLAAGDVLLGLEPDPTSGTPTIEIEAANTVRFQDRATIDVRNFANTAIPQDGFTSVFFHASTIDLANAVSVEAGTGFGITENGTNIVFQADTIMLSNQVNVTSDAVAFGDAGSVFFTADMVDIGGNAVVSTSSQSSAQANAGDIAILADMLTLDGRSRVLAETFNDGDAGTITFNAAEIDLGGEAAVSATTSSGSGQGGDIVFTADRITLDGLAGVVTDTIRAGGDGGDITFTATDTVTIADAARLQASTRDGTGAGGNVLIEADAILMTGIRPRIFVDTIVSTQRSGNITLRANGIRLQDGAAILAEALGSQGDLGTITLDARNGQLIVSGDARIGAQQGPENDLFGNLQLPEGNGGEIILTGGQILFQDNGRVLSQSAASLGTTTGDISLTATQAIILSDSSRLSTSAFSFDNLPQGSSDAGTITLRAPNVEIRDMATIDALLSRGSGTAGNVQILDATRIIITDNVSLQTSAFSSNNPGDAPATGGAVQLAAQAITIDGNAQIRSQQTGGDSAAGTVFIDAQGLLMIAGNADVNAGITVQGTGGAPIPNAIGQGGVVRLTGGEVILAGGDIRAQSVSQNLMGAGAGNAGEIAILATNGDLQARSGVRVSTTADGQVASGGPITLTAPNGLVLLYPGSSVQSGVILTRQPDNSIALAFGGAGNVSADGQFVVAFGGSVVTAGAIDGTGGRIEFPIGRSFIDPAAFINNTSLFGEDGILIAETAEEFETEFNVLPPGLADPRDLTGDPCTAEAKGVSSLALQRSGSVRLSQTDTPVLFLGAVPFPGEDSVAGDGSTLASYFQPVVNCTPTKG